MSNKDLDEFRNLIYASIISADNDEFGLSEADKQEIIKRRRLTDNHWDWIFDPIKDKKQRETIISIFKQ